MPRTLAVAIGAPRAASVQGAHSPSMDGVLKPTDVETSKTLLSVRDDILSEIRSLKVVLLEEIQSAKKHTAYISTNASSSSSYQVGTHENMTATGSQRSVATHGAGNSNQFKQGRMSLALSSLPSHGSSVGTHETMIASGSQRSVATHGTGISNQFKQGRLSLGLASVPSHGSNFNTVTSNKSTKSTARLHDEAILEDWRQQRRLVGDAKSMSFARTSRTTSQAVKTYLHKTSAVRNESDGTNLYHQTGFCQQVAKHYLFEHVTLAVVVLNAFWMSVDADVRDAESITNAHLPYVIADVMFYSYYVVEILVRFLAFRRKAWLYKDRWFVFDLALVILYTLDPFVFGVIQYANGEDNGGGLGLSTESLRLFRLVRLFRLTRLLRNAPKLLIIITGMASSLSTVGYTFGMFGLITYVFAIALRNTVPARSAIETQYFPTLLETMHHLLIYGAFLDNLSDFILDVKDGSVACFMLSWLYIFFAHLMILNVLVGILCEAMAMVSSAAGEDYVVKKVSDKFFKLLSEYEGSEEGHIGWEEFVELLATGGCQDALRKFDVDIDALVDMVEDQFFCSDVGGGAITISFTEIIGLIVDLRGSKTASVRDVLAIGRRLNTKFQELKESLELFEILTHG